MADLELKIAGFYRRGLSFFIDELVVSIARVTIIILFSLIFINKKINEISKDLYDKVINLQDNSNLSDVIHVITQTQIWKFAVNFAIIFVATGFFYQILTYYFLKGRTIGKYFSNIIVLKKDKTLMTFGDIFARVIFSYIPWILPLVIYYLFQDKNILYLPLGVMWFFWYEPWIFFVPKGCALHDVFSGTRVYSIPKIEHEENKNE